MVTAAKVYEEDSDEILDESEVDETAEEETVEEDEEEAPKPSAKKPKAKKVVDEDEEEESAPAKKKVSGVKSKGKEKANVKTTKEKSHRGTAKAKPATARASRTGDRPFLPTSGIGRAFKLAESGVKVAKLKQFIADNDLQPWVLSFIRKGATLNGKFAWRVEEENGRIQVSGLRKVSASAKKAA